MTIHYTITEQDYIAYNLFHYGQSRSVKRTLLLLRVLFPLMVILMAFLYSRINMFYLVIAVVFSIVWFFLYPYFFRRSLTRGVKRVMKEGKVNEFIGEKSLTLGDTHVLFQEGRGNTEFMYEAMERIASDQERLYLYFGTITACIVPFSAFQTAEDKEQFMRLLEEKTGIQRNM